MTVADWLSARRPAPPTRLADRMLSAASASQQAANENLVEGTRAASLHLLAVILAEKTPRRSSALDLLAADALMTYSCEAACDDPESLVQTADNSIAALLASHTISPDTATSAA